MPQMESIYSLPAIYNLLSTGEYAQAFTLVEKHIEILSPQLQLSLPEDISFEPEICLVLSKFYLIRREYSQAVAYALKSKSVLHTLDAFYFDSLIYRMMEQLLITQEHGELREFVLELIKDDALDDSLIGYLVQIKQYDILKEKVVLLSRSEIECKDILQILMEQAPKEMAEILLECSTDNECFMEHVIDALVVKKDYARLQSFVSELPWEKMYAACFYIEDTHHIADLEIDNENAKFILSGDWKQEILSNFLFKNNKTNFKFLESLSKARAPYMALSNSIMNAGTTNDTLYRNNKSLISGKDWTKFIEISSLGMIHQGNIDPFEILKEILPSLESSSGEPGALMALGIMNAGKNEEETTEYLLNWIDNGSDQLIFGACIGLGLNTMESCNMQLYERLKALFSVDNTIAQESALYAIGLIFSSSENRDVLDFIRSIHDKTDFPRVKRVCGLATALINIMTDDREELFDSLDSADSSIRSMALLSLGAAYTATSNLKVIEKILPFVNDGDDEAKRSAVIAIALIGYGDINLKQSCLIPLAENHNPFVRSAAALVLGFFNAGTCDFEVSSILEALLYDSDDLVKQSACIGCGFCLMQGNPSLIPNYKRTMDRINYIIVSRVESSCSKIGALLGRSIAETSGKAAIFSIKNFSDQVISTKVAGALLFLFFWYWYPCLPCLSLCLHPTPLYFFDENLDETDHFFMNSDIYYYYLVKLPELKKSRKFKPSKSSTPENKDILDPVKVGLKSGDKLSFKERSVSNLGTGILFRKK